jgi:hypothetical protein
VSSEENEPAAAPHHAPGNALTEDYSGCSAARVFAAAIRAAAELGFPIAARDDTRTTFTFVLGRPNTAWPGQAFITSVIPEADGARIVVNAKPTGYRLLMADWHQAKAVGILFLQRVSSVLEGERETAPDAPPPASLKEQLESLADLRDRGFLSEEEFGVAKERLLA